MNLLQLTKWNFIMIHEKTEWWTGAEFGGGSR